LRGAARRGAAWRGVVPRVAVFLLMDKRDEYTLVNFILSFKALQFVTLGFVGITTTAFTYHLCLTSKDPHACEKAAPGVRARARPRLRNGARPAAHYACARVRACAHSLLAAPARCLPGWPVRVAPPFLPASAGTGLFPHGGRVLVPVLDGLGGLRAAALLEPQGGHDRGRGR
jgi:hypothetical protein